MKVLIIEDDEGLRRGLSFSLGQDGMETVTAGLAAEGLQRFEEQRPDAVLMDLNLPDGDGIDLCRRIRKRSDVPILMLTARDMEIDEIMGLESGADDYLTKPFSISVLKIRLAKLRERKSGKKKSAELVSGGIRLDAAGLRAYRDGEPLDLSLTEFRLLQYFLENQNRVLLKEQIIAQIWDIDANFVEENTLPVNISRLRRKIGGDRIRTIHGMGYLWQDQEL